MSPTSAQAIQSELRALWASDEQGTGRKKKLGVQHNYTVNLVVFTPGHGFCAEVEEVLHELAGIHPGRYIVLCPAGPAATEPLAHHVSGHCVYAAGTDKKICCDIINLVAQDALLEKLYSLTLGLLIPDLPVEMWWVGDRPLESLFFRRIAEKADRVWLDSAKFQTPAPALSRLARVWPRDLPSTVLGDLNWIRLARWRALIAELFDGEWTPFLADIRHVAIEYSAGRKPTRSFLLACWLATRLGWTYRGMEHEQFPDSLDFASSSGSVTVEIKPAAVPNPERDRLYAVRITTGGKHAGLFSVVRDEDPQCVIAHSVIDGKQAFSRVLCFEHLEPPQLFKEGLNHLGRDIVWEETLAAVRQILKEPPTQAAIP